MAKRTLPENIEALRQRMLNEDLAGRDIVDPEVLAAMAKVKRHEFVPPMLVNDAYSDHPLRIGCGQTISQPYVVAFMTQALKVKTGMKILEIGTGSGYQAAVLAEMGARVFSIERYEDLSLAAEETLNRLGYGDEIYLRVDDGTLGWPEEAPFDRVLVTAAGPQIPESLKEQLAVGGLLLIPRGDYRGSQKLVLLEKTASGYREEELLDVVFVPLIGREGY